MSQRTAASPSSGTRRRTPAPPPLWRRLAAVGLMLIVIGYAISLMHWGEAFPGLDEASAQLPPYTNLAGGVLLVLAIAAYGLRRARGIDDPSDTHRSVEIARTAVASEMKMPIERVRVRIRRSLFRRIRRVRIQLLPRGHVTDDPGARLAEKLTPVLGQLRRSEWDPRKSLVTLVPGAPEPDDSQDDVPEAATDPVGRATQILDPVVKATSSAVAESTEEGRPTKIVLRHPTNLALGSSENRAKLVERIEQMMPESPNGHGWSAEVVPQRDEIVVFEQPAIPNYLLHPVLDYDSLFPGRRVLPCATGPNGEITGWDISRSTQKPHALLVGPTGGGKTNIITTLVVGAARQGARSEGDIEIWGLDPKQIELMALEGYPGVTQLAYTVEDMAALIDATYAEMQNRYTAVREKRLHPDELPALVVILDEFLILSSMLTYWWKAVKKGRGPCPQLNKLVQLLALARSAGIYLCLGIQRPDASVFPEGARDNLRFRASLDVLSPQGAEMMWHDRHIGTTPTNIRGRGVFTSLLTGDPMRAQGWHTPNVDSSEMYRRRLSPEHRQRVDELRPADYTPRGLTNDELWLPPSARSQISGGVEDEMRDVEEVVKARHLNPGDRIKLEDDSGRMTAAVVEEVEVDEDSDTVTLDVLFEEGGGRAEQHELDGAEEVWFLGQALGVG